jgi:hypothetical protein
MKHFTSYLICLMLCASVRAEDEGYRTFTDVDGRTFKGKLTDYDVAAETAVMMRIDGKKGRIPLAVFSEADRLFISDWGALYRFQQGLEVMPSLNSTPVSDKDSRLSDTTKKVFDSFYEIRFINRTDIPFGKIAFEYCIFYNQGERKRRNVQYEEGVCYGKGTVEGLDPSSEHVSNTRSVRLYTDGGKVGLFGSESVALANIWGIWLRLKTTLPSGNEIVRDYRTADVAEWKWAPYSFGAGLNEGPKEQTYYFVE